MLASEFNEYFEMRASYKTSQLLFNQKGKTNNIQSLEGLNKGKPHVKSPDIVDQTLKS